MEKPSIRSIISKVMSRLKSRRREQIKKRLEADMLESEMVELTQWDDRWMEDTDPDLKPDKK